MATALRWLVLPFGGLAPSTPALLRRRPAVAVLWWCAGVLGSWGLFALVFRSAVGFVAWLSILAGVSLSSAVLTARCLRNSPSPTIASLCASAALGLAYLVVVAVLVARVTPARLYVTPTNSMVPTLEPGALLVVDISAYRADLPARGDTVLFRSPLNPQLKLIKRVLGLPGERIAVRNERVTVNARPIDEPYLVRAQTPLARDAAQSVVPNGYLFVLGDNRPASFDSRSFGPIPRSLLEGRVCFALPFHLSIREHSLSSPASDNL